MEELPVEARSAQVRFLLTRRAWLWNLRESCSVVMGTFLSNDPLYPATRRTPGFLTHFAWNDNSAAIVISDRGQSQVLDFCATGIMSVIALSRDKSFVNIGD